MPNTITEYKTDIVEEEYLDEKDGKVKTRIVKVAGYWIWNILHLKELHDLECWAIDKDNPYHSYEWIPEIFDDKIKRWVKASRPECENWKSIPNEEKRVKRLCIIFPDT